MRAFTEQALDAVQDYQRAHRHQRHASRRRRQQPRLFLHAIDAVGRLPRRGSWPPTAQNIDVVDQEYRGHFRRTSNRLSADLQAGKGLAGTVLQNEQLATNVQDHRRQSRHHQQQLEPARIMGHFSGRINRRATNTASSQSALNHDSTLGHPHFVSRPVHVGGYAISQVRPEFIGHAARRSYSA